MLNLTSLNQFSNYLILSIKKFAIYFTEFLIKKKKYISDN